MDPCAGSTAAADTNSRRSSSSPRRAAGQRADQAAGAGVELAAREQGGDPRVLLQRRERVGAVGDHREVADVGRGGRRGAAGSSRRRSRWRRRRRPGRPAWRRCGPWPGLAAEPVGERLGPDGHARRRGCAGSRPSSASRSRSRRMVISLTSSSTARSATRALPDRSMRGSDVVQRSIASTLMVVRLPGGGAASARSANTPRAMPWTSALPTAVASTGPVPTGVPLSSASGRAEERRSGQPAERARSARPRRAARAPGRPPWASESMMQRTTTPHRHPSPGRRRRRSRRACPRG